MRAQILIRSVFMANLCMSGYAYAQVDPSATVVTVQGDCAIGNQAIENCFSSLSDLSVWLGDVRKPNEQSPLAVEIYPGLFQDTVSIQCNPADGYTGYISFNGAGNGQTILKGNMYSAPLHVDSCTGLSFSHLTIQGDFYGGVLWDGGGFSRWNDVDVIGVARAWYENRCGSERGNHYWFGSRVQATAAFTLANTYRATCDESWFFGSELTAIVPSGASGNGGVLTATEQGIIHAYGSVLRLLVDGPGNIPAIRVGAIGEPSASVTGGEVHLHGTGIDVISETGRNVVAMNASAHGMIHANASAYNLRTTGSVTRIVNTGGHVSAPYQWDSAAEAPEITSVTGSDIAVVTNTPDGQPHLVVYSSQCGSGWYDIVEAACR